MTIYFLRNKTLVDKEIADKIIEKLKLVTQSDQGFDCLLMLDEIRVKANDSTYEFCNDNIEKYLRNQNFLEDDGDLKEEVRDIALSAIHVVNQTPTYTDPIVKIYEVDEFFDRIDELNHYQFIKIIG